MLALMFGLVLAAVLGASVAAPDAPSAPVHRRGPTTALPIVRVVGPPETTASVTSDIERGTRTALAWFIDARPIADRQERAAATRAIRACGDDNRCVAARLRQYAIDRGVYVVANLAVTPALVTVEVLDSAGGRTVGRTLANLDTAQVRPVTKRAVAKAMRKAGHRLGGRVDAQGTPGDAELVLQNAAGDFVDVAALLEPGTYRLDVQRDGFESDNQPVEVRPGRTAAVTFRLEEKDPIWTKWWLWTAAAVVVGGAVTAAVIATTPDDVAVCHPVPGTSC